MVASGSSIPSLEIDSILSSSSDSSFLLAFLSSSRLNKQLFVVDRNTLVFFPIFHDQMRRDWNKISRGRSWNLLWDDSFTNTKKGLSRKERI